MADSVTTNYGWAYPTVGGDSAVWGSTLNTTIIAIDADLKEVAQSVPSYTAVQQGGGAGMATTGVQIGANTAGSALLAEVGTTPYGFLLHSSFSSGSANQGGAVTISASAPSGTPNDGDLWIEHV